MKDDSIELLVSAVKKRGLCSIAQAESLKYKLLAGLPVRRACYGVLRFVMESGAKGCETIVSGKLRGQRAKAMKFRDGYMIKSGHSVEEYIDVAVRHCLLRQGVLGVRVSIMLPHDPTGEFGPTKTLADVVTVLDPKEESEPQQKYQNRHNQNRENRGGDREHRGGEHREHRENRGGEHRENRGGDREHRGEQQQQQPQQPQQSQPQQA